MFKEFSKFYLQKVESLKKQGLVYSINSNGKIIGTLQETNNSSKQIRNQLIKLISLFLLTIPKRIILENLDLELLDEEGIMLGTIKKEVGFYKDLILYSKNGEHIATVKSTVKVKSLSITVIDANGNNFIKAMGRYGATDFTVSDSSTSKQVSSIRKRSLVYETIKENLINNDVYHIENSYHKEELTLALIGIVVAIDIYFHMGQ